jgi:hypothetical protein
MSKVAKPLLVALIALSLGLVGCVTTFPTAPSAFSFEKKPRKATASKVGEKSGEVCQTSILRLAPLTFGEKGYYKAAKNAGVSNIASVSDSYTQFLFLYSRHCTIVTGS